MMETITIKNRIAEIPSIVICIIVSIIFWLFYQSFIVFLLLFSYFLLIGFAHWYVRKISKVKWRVVQYHERLFIDEKGHCKIYIQNDMNIPTPFLNFCFRSQKGIDWHIKENWMKRGDFYSIPLSLSKNEEIVIDLNAQAKRRGKWQWDQIEIVMSDPFRLITLHLTYKHEQAPIFHVYPRIAKVNIPETNRWQQGYRAATVSPLYNETKIIGVKPYEGEAFRSIHWGATARTGTLSTKKYEPSQGDRYAVYLNLVGKNSYTWRSDTEWLIEVTIGVCKQLFLQDCSFELWVNCVHNNSILQIGSGRDRSQLYRALQLLSVITDNDLPVSSEIFFKSGFRKQEPGAIPLIIGYPPQQQTNWLQVVK
ncbi:DUF58 domain-containing protein [Bacillus cereus]|uniref:DUF58 domain-containing protein n=1 Tax=Bacillus cereus TaxID=1396 RepID=UPI003EDF93E8